MRFLITTGIGGAMFALYWMLVGLVDAHGNATPECLWHPRTAMFCLGGFVALLAFAEAARRELTPVSK